MLFPRVATAIGIWIGLAGMIAQAGVVHIFSRPDLNSTNEWNSVTTTDVVINPYADGLVWKLPTSANWVSYIPSGLGEMPVGDVLLVNGVPQGNPTASFFNQFTLPGNAISGQIEIWADDTAAVFLDGNPVIPLTGTITRAFWCATASISCTPSGGGTVDLSGLGAGTHTLQIDAYQLWGHTFGIMYEGSVTFVDIPEPSSLLLVICGAAALVLRRARRR